MATSGIINGTNLLVFDMNGALHQAIGYSTSCTLSITHSPRTTTNSTSGGWVKRMAGERDWEVSCDAFVSMVSNPTNTTNRNFYTMFQNYILNRTVIRLKFGNEVTGDYYFDGNAFLTSMELNGANEESATYSMTFLSAGALTGQRNL
jgi:predicted secreted protein